MTLIATISHLIIW